MKNIKMTHTQINQPPTIGESIRFFRKMRNMSASELALKTNVSTTLIRSIENGNRNIGDKLLIDISSALNVEREVIENAKKIKLDDQYRDALSQLTQKELEKLFKIFLVQNRQDHKETILNG